MNYTHILNEFNKIDKQHTNIFNHEKKHAENVINNVIKLANILNINKEEKILSTKDN